ncbi:MAG TPA: chemotaxis protein CheB [Polyangia bacterium]|nr:chemotaxis protein CheB [Polyangia bacterium]
MAKGKSKGTLRVPSVPVRIAQPSGKSRVKSGEIPGFPVVGVGASAGGLDAFSALLRRIPVDARLAVVLVQHLSPKHKSHLPKLLENATTLPIRQAKDRMRIEPGHVYVIPPDARMSVIDGKLRVGRRPSDASQYTPLDHFLRSLADVYVERSIAVVLSGTASDGAAGVTAVKAAGGITFAQDPEEAKFDGMPRAAIATGAIDLVLPTARIAAELVRLSRHPFLLAERAAPEGRQTDATDEGAAAADPSVSYHEVFGALKKVMGVDFTHYKLPTISRRIQRRMVLRRTPDLAAYVRLLQSQRDEVEALYEDLLIHVTSFFREPEAFDVLKTRVFPKLLAAREADAPIRIWVPGCSSGEEVYSVAIALTELLDARGEIVPFQIFGTDVSQKMIDKARAAVYPTATTRDLDPGRLRRFFSEVDGGFRITKTIRERCVFSRQDLTRDPPFSRLDLVVCRNLLIYLGYPLQRKVMAVFHFGLRASGFLMLGRSETTAAHDGLFALYDKRFKIYEKKTGAFKAPLDLSGGDLKLAPPEARPSSSKSGPTGLREDSATNEMSRLLVDRYGPPGVLVDRDLRVVRTHGRTGRYLELPTGEAKLNLLQMVRPGLLFGVRAAVREAQKGGVRVRKEGLEVRADGDAFAVDVDVTPVGSGTARHLLVLFEEPSAAATSAPVSKSTGRRRGVMLTSPADTVKRLEAELIANREYLHTIIEDLETANEELQSANEEVLSSNEELQSSNEELETAREELQSSNEELSTVNEELQSRNEEMSRVNDDLLNVLANIRVAIVMVSSDLRIRRFTPAAEKMLNLIPTDVGRPIGHVKPNIDAPNLEATIVEVIRSVSPRELEVSDPEGNAYSVQIRPYRSLEGKIEGAVLTVVDVAALRVARECAEAIMGSVSEPVLLLDASLRVMHANPAFYEAFRTTRAETDGTFIYDLGNGQWDVADLRTLLQDVLPARKNFAGFVIEHAFPSIGRTRMVVDGRRIESSNAADGVILLIMREVAKVDDPS